MANLTEAEPLAVSTEGRKLDLPAPGQADSLSAFSGSGNPWNYSTISGLFLLILVWTYKLCTTWQGWGNLTIDSGHEMYVPWLLALGKQLYRDAWFPFGPGGPYFTSFLYRVFGVKMDVLYWAGALSALGSAIFLYLTGLRLGSWFAGWAAGAVVLLEAFQPSLFSFPLPYSSAAVYGCLTGCVFLWAVVNATFSEHWSWIFVAGSAAGIGFLLKPEFGLASYACLFLAIATRRLCQRSWGVLARDFLAITPGIALCAVVVRWMVSIAGAEFITQENIQSWPSSYFMKTYGKTWLERNGFTISGFAFLGAFHRGITVAVVLMALWILLRWRGSDARSLLGKALLVTALVWYLVEKNFFVLAMRQSLTLVLSTVFFPVDMVLYAITSAFVSWCYLWRRPMAGRNSALPLVFTFSGLLAFRVLMKMSSLGYPIYYNGPVVLSYLLLLGMIIPRPARSRRVVFLAECALCLACLVPVFLNTRAEETGTRDFVPYTTSRGTIRVPKSTAAIYAAAVQFMKEKAALGQAVLSVPEDTSLYFLSGTYSPTRVYLFIPGAVAPGKMTEETLAEIDRKPVQYLLWSNRTFPEYGAPEFGIDFNREIGDYLKSHYHPLGPLLPNDPAAKVWPPVVWERNQQNQR